MTRPQDVLQGYFDDLLAEPVQPVPAAEPRPVAEPVRETPVAEPAVSPQAREKLARLLSSRPPAPVVETRELKTASTDVKAVELKQAELKPAETPVAPPPAEEALASTDQQLAEAVAEMAAAVEVTADTLAWQANGRPAWAQSRFDVLLFEVAGLTLAVPLIALGQIQPLTDELTPLFGQARWFMGLQPTPMGKIRTINTALFVMPERYRDEFAEAARYVISINGLPWGLAVDAVNQPITLQPEDVKWRSERSQRPWLAGTVKQHMCALLDIEAMGQMLQMADKPGAGGDPFRS